VIYSYRIKIKLYGCRVKVTLYSYVTLYCYRIRATLHGNMVTLYGSGPGLVMELLELCGGQLEVV